MARLTENRRLLQAAIKPLLEAGERCGVTVAESETERGATKVRFAVTVTVGPTGDEIVAERLDELLSGPVTDALQACELRPKVTKHSGYHAVVGANGEQLLGATWTAELFE